MLAAGTRILARFLSPQEVIIGDIIYISIVQTIATVYFNENLAGKHLEDIDDSTPFYFHVVLIWREVDNTISRWKDSLRGGN
jgi:hypothetical protein